MTNVIQGLEVNKFYLAVLLSMFIAMFGAQPSFAATLENVVVEDVGHDFVKANGINFIVTKDTDIRNINGAKIPIKRIFPKYKVDIEYTQSSGHPAATRIKVVREPRGT